MSKAESGGAAFPTMDCDEASLSNGGSYTREHGMTKREYFAAKALQGIIANGEAGTYDNTVRYGSSVRAAAKIAVEMADALLVELNK
jgi:hypothetical protein